MTLNLAGHAEAPVLKTLTLDSLVVRRVSWEVLCQVLVWEGQNFAGKPA